MVTNNPIPMSAKMILTTRKVVGNIKTTKIVRMMMIPPAKMENVVIFLGRHWINSMKIREIRAEMKEQIRTVFNWEKNVILVETPMDA